MRDLATLFVHLIWTVFRLLSPGGVRSVVAESVLLRHPLVILNRPRERAPNLRRTDRLIAGLFALLIRPARVLRGIDKLSRGLGPTLITQVRLAPNLDDHAHRGSGLSRRRRRTTPSRSDEGQLVGTP